MPRLVVLAAALLVWATGCMSFDAPPTASDPGSEDPASQAAQHRIAELEAELARVRSEGPGDAGELADSEVPAESEVPAQVTRWEQQALPRRFGVAGSGFAGADELVFSLAQHLAGLGSSDAGDSVTVRIDDRGNTVVGEIVVDGYPDDSVRGHEFRATMRNDGTGWHLVRVVRRQLCWRGGGRDVCL